ncbi:MAG: hypothetical protein FWB95_01350 [Treponema sp.]|nr:hypothetical protein [Treponema sp.]
MTGRSIIYKVVTLSALVSMMFHVSFYVVAPIIDCKDSCTCGCANAEMEAAAAEMNLSSCCSSQIAVTVTKGCCSKEGSHESHFTSPKSGNFRNIQGDLRSSVFNNIVLSEISGIDSKNCFSPVDIVYFIFKPPIA